ncbi:MAG: tRNA pseudouridine(38-40) synthase TruA [Clostridia bacterium]|nr:tRNA pseudouridine(38-40) synthase TruA [Clostridia bacterium]
MSRAVLRLSYDGTGFHGWQVQSNAVTVQGLLMSALETLFSRKVPVAGCSRTDAGVHAKTFVCHADLPSPFPLERLPLALNALLPGGIVVHEAKPAPADFHARFSCKGKTYRYLVHNARVRDPFLQNRAYFYPKPLDAIRMNEAAAAYVGTHDFYAFMASGAEVEDTVRTIYDFRVIRNVDQIDFVVTGNGFLYNMVRIMVGTLISGEAGKLSHPISEIIALRDRTKAGITVPAHGLYLENVFYD